ncbi:hypothetical protein OC834_006378 [Tilletia horrida]|nr:hypothetical protein OC834_006378 [Tilletia horrida]KAK0522470.1 hypothetical protein OC835_006559 [Tilletia horrida]
MGSKEEQQPLLLDARSSQDSRSNANGNGFKPAAPRLSSTSGSSSSSSGAGGASYFNPNGSGNGSLDSTYSSRALSQSSASTTGVETPDGIARPLSAASLRVRVEKQSQATADALAMYNRPPNGFEDYEEPDIWTPRGGAPLYAQHSLYWRLRLAWSQLLALILSSSFLIFIIVWALSIQVIAALLRLAPWPFSRVFIALGLLPPEGGVRLPPTNKDREWDDHKRWKKEKLVKDVRYYASTCGFEIVNEQVETEDGFYLRVNRIIDKEAQLGRHADGKGGFPVLIMHGLFQSSGSFVTSEERSLAFWLARHGKYQVFLGNNRGVFDMGHRKYSRSDPRFWDWNIRDLALYDLPALVDYVRRTTGYDKIAFIGHSQGNGTMFISLSLNMVPDLGTKLTYFGALAPAVFAGPLTTCFPFTALSTMDWQTWRRFFGVLDFIPLMKISYDLCPAYPYALLGYQMFAFLFAWTDANWLPRRKAKMFRFTPQPVSSASIFWWAGKEGFATRGCTLDPNAPRWYDGRFPPVSIYSGGMDFLVLTDPLIKRFQEQEEDVRLIRWKRQEEAEDIEATRLRYPEELEGNGKASARIISVFEEDVARKTNGLPQISTLTNKNLAREAEQDGDQTPTNASFNKGRFE